MLKNYLKIAVRNLLQQKLNSTLNIVGLALGLACGLLIIFHVKEELSYDTHFSKADRIFRITNQGLGDDTRHWAATPPLLAVLMQQDIPEIARVARFHYIFSKVLSYQPPTGLPKRFEEKGGYFADSSVVDVFDLKFSQGDPKTALREINGIVLTKEMAKRYFGDENPIGKTLHNDSENFPMKVTGVLEEMPGNTHLKFDYLLSMSTFYKVIDQGSLNSRGWNGFYNYVLLRDAKDRKAVEAKLPDFQVKFRTEPGQTRAQILATSRYQLQPITDIHLHSKLEKEMGPNSDIAYVYIFSISALFILLLAGINFINIATAQAFKRMKEVGVRKALGASKQQLVRQFMGESFLLTIVATFLAITLFKSAIPFYNNLTGKSLDFSRIITLENTALISVIVVAVGLLAGFYPAWFSSNFNVISSLKGGKSPTSSVNLVRKGLIIFQFVVSVFMIFSTVIIYQQTKFFQSRELGFDKDKLVAVKLYGDMREQVIKNTEVFKNELLKNASVAQVALVSTLPGERFSIEGLTPQGTPENADLPGIRFMRADEELLPTLGIDLQAGHNFFKPASDTVTSFIVNEATVKALKLKSPIGQIAVNSLGEKGEIVGVVKDFNFASLHMPIEPLVIQYKPQWAGYLLVKIRGNGVPETLRFLRTNMAAISPESLFIYSFVDENLDRLYDSENRMSNIFKVFAVFAILISCLGLFGLSAYAAQLRIKEIGIRKVLGASTTGIVSLLSKDFLKLVLIANLIAWPLAWWVMNQWLQGFAYRIHIGWWVFALTGMAALLIALLTVSYQAIKAALANPVKSLRTE